jgi:hypothetical protein
MKVAIIHYHLGTSGVSSVIERGSRELTRRGIAHVILVGQCSQGMADTLPVRVVDGLAYSNAPLDTQEAEKILDALRAAATDALGAPPDIWHFHNHSLGKNRAVSLIVSMLASQRERLLLHIHDLAEDGRPENSRNITDIPNLYPIAPQIHYSFINSRDRHHFIKAGLPAANAHLMPNPVSDADSIPRTTSKTPNTPALLLCPARGIRRKNIGELILLTLLAPKGTRTAITLALKIHSGSPSTIAGKNFATQTICPSNLPWSTALRQTRIQTRHSNHGSPTPHTSSPARSPKALVSCFLNPSPTASPSSDEKSNTFQTTWRSMESNTMGFTKKSSSPPIGFRMLSSKRM